MFAAGDVGVGFMGEVGWMGDDGVNRWMQELLALMAVLCGIAML